MIGGGRSLPNDANSSQAGDQHGSLTRSTGEDQRGVGEPQRDSGGSEREAADGPGQGDSGRRWTMLKPKWGFVDPRSDRELGRVDDEREDLAARNGHHAGPLMCSHHLRSSGIYLDLVHGARERGHSDEHQQTCNCKGQHQLYQGKSAAHGGV